MHTGHGPEDVKARAALQALVCKFGLVTEAVTFTMDVGGLVNKDIEALWDDMNRFHQELEQYAATAEVSNGNILKVIAKMQEMSNSRNSEVRARMTHLENAMASFHPGPPSPPTAPRCPRTSQAFAGIQGIDGNTPLGVATKGGNKVIISANYLFNMVRELQAQVDILTEQSKNTGVIFGQLAFALEAEFTYWLTSQNPSGAGLAGFVNLISIWAFAAGNSVKTVTWLNETHHAKSVGLKGGHADAVYAHSMSRRYPACFVGKEKNAILSTMTIKMLESYNAWRGTIMGNGQKEQLTNDLQMAVACHRQYCMDYVPAGTLQDTALKTAEYTMQFWNALTAYIEDEYTFLLSFKLLPKHVLLLLSNQVVQIYDDMFEFRDCATNVDLQNPVALASRYAWVTLQVLGTMDGYQREKFCCHQAINSTFICFLTRHTADQTSVGLKGTVDSLKGSVAELEKKLRALEVDGSKKITQEMFNCLESKLENVISANNLKMNANRGT